MSYDYFGLIVSNFEACAFKLFSAPISTYFFSKKEIQTNIRAN